MAASLPDAKVEIAFATLPNQPPTWVDVTPWLQSFSFTRGRQRELNTIQTGTASVTLDNRDRRFDGSNISSPYYPFVLPTRRLRISGTWAGTTTPQFNGFIDGWPQTWNGWQDAEAPLTASDGFKVLNFAQLNTSFVQARSDVRIGDVLTSIGWTVGGAQWTLGDAINGLLGSTTVLGPVGDRNLGVGTTQIQAGTLSQTSALSHMQDVAQTENGLLFMGKDASVTFIPFRPNPPASVATFGEQELVYAGLTLQYDDNSIFNDVHMTRVGGVEQVVDDATSQAQYFLRTLTYTNTLQAYDSTAKAMASYLLSISKQPLLEVISMDLDGTADPTNLWPHILQREIGDIVTVVRRPPGGGTPISQVSMIQGITTSYTAEGGDWLTSFSLTTATHSGPFWILGDPTLGVLGATTTLFY